MSYTLAEISAVAVADCKEIPSDWNGSAGTVDLSRPSDHTGDFGKICATGGNLNLKDTMEYLLWIAQGKPTAKTAVTQDHVEEAIPHMRNMIARYRIYKIFHASGVSTQLRDSDVFEHSDIPLSAVQEDVACVMHTILTNTADAEDRIAEAGQLLLYSIVANAIHREQHNGNSWLSEELTNRRSPTFKVLQVAGRLRDKFRDYMLAYGHDGNHHLSDAAIDEQAKVLSGFDESKIVGTYLEYAGKNINGENLKDVFNLGEAVKGRYPAGILGKASLIVGLDMYKAMIANIAVRVKLTGTSGITENAMKLKNKVAGTNLDHQVLIKLGGTLGPMFATIFGYLVKADVLREDEYLAFKNVANRHPADKVSGESLATAMKRVAPHREAITSAIVNILTAMSETLATAAGLSTGKIAAGGLTPILDNVTKVDSSAIKAEVGAIGNETTFYDASM
jgi:hypothetical protein